MIQVDKAVAPILLLSLTFNEGCYCLLTVADTESSSTAEHTDTLEPTTDTEATTNDIEVTTETTVSTGPDTTSYPTSEAMTSATIEPNCGDGFVEGHETCDDGNSDNTDDCLDTCLPASCGDGFVQVGVEGCDDANIDNTDDCLDTCVPASCGDGFVQQGTESCDDANASNNDGCLDTCEPASCGDGFVHFGVEQCDVSGENQYCSETCQKTGLIVFVSSEKTTGQIEYEGLKGMAAADAWCSDLAAAFTTDIDNGSGYDNDGVSWPYKAWLSSSSLGDDVNLAPDKRFASLANQSYADLAYVRRDGEMVAEDSSGLLTDNPDDNPMLAYSISLDEKANIVDMEAHVWTNTDSTGSSPTVLRPCAGQEGPAWNSGEGSANCGEANVTTNDWTDAVNTLCVELHHFYCFEQPPEND